MGLGGEGERERGRGCVSTYLEAAEGHVGYRGHGGRDLTGSATGEGERCRCR